MWLNLSVRPPPLLLCHIRETVSHLLAWSPRHIQFVFNLILDIHAMVNWKVQNSASPDQCHTTVSGFRFLIHWGDVLFKVARYCFSRLIPPKFEHKLRRHKQSFGKIATTVVLDKDENLLWSGLQRHWSCHSNEMTLLPILLAAVYLSTGNSGLDVREV